VPDPSLKPGGGSAATAPTEMTVVKPPDTTTKPPDTTTKPPDTTTKPPDTTTKPPDTTTKPPDTTTKPPPKDDCADDELPCLKVNVPGMGSGSGS